MELTAIAAKYKDHVEGIANAILDRIVEVPVERKLPSWYLLDSILKNVGDQFRLYFAGRLDTIFIDTCRKLSPCLLPVMVHLFRTWGKFTPSFARYSIEDFLQKDHTPVTSGDLRHSGSHSPHRSHGHVNAKYLEAHLRMEHSTVVPVERKLPSWYLLDSILKNVGDQYRLYFAGRLDTIFIDTYKKLRHSLLPVMVHHFRTWGKFVPSFARYSIEDFLQKDHTPVSSGDLRHSGSHSPHLSHGHVNAKYLEAHLRMEHSTVWDPVSENGTLEEENQIPTSNEPGNHISLHKLHGTPNVIVGKKTTFLQETCFDEACSYLVYAPVDMEVRLRMDGPN